MDKIIWLVLLLAFIFVEAATVSVVSLWFAAGALVALIAAMLAGRAVWGVASMILRGIAGTGFTWAAFMAGAFTSAVPGIILHIVLIPVVVMALQRALPWMKQA